MGRLATDGHDALLVTKLKVMLREVFEAPTEKKRKPPLPSYESFVHHLDPDDPVARKAVEILAKDVLSRARRRRAAVQTSTTSANSVPSTSSVRLEDTAPRHPSSSASSLSQPLLWNWDEGSANHSRSANNNNNNIIDGRDGNEDEGWVSSAAFDLSNTDRLRREAAEYDSIIAAAQRRVASPLPLHPRPSYSLAAAAAAAASADLVANANANAEERNRDPSATTRGARSSRTVTTVEPASSRWSHTLFNDADWPDLSREHVFPWELAGGSAAAPAGRESMYSARPARRQRRRRRAEEGDQLGLDWWAESESDDDGFSRRRRRDEGEEDDGSDTEDGGEATLEARLLDAERALNRARSARDAADRSTGGSARPGSSAATRHAIIERLERRRRERASQGTTGGPDASSRAHEAFSSLFPSSATRHEPLPHFSDVTLISTLPLPEPDPLLSDPPGSAFTSPFAASSLPIIVGGDFSDVPTSVTRSGERSDTLRARYSSSTPNSAIPTEGPTTSLNSQPVPALPDAPSPGTAAAAPLSSLQRTHSIRRSGFHTSPTRSNSVASGSTPVLPRTTQSPLSRSSSFPRMIPRSPLAPHDEHEHEHSQMAGSASLSEGVGIDDGSASMAARARSFEEASRAQRSAARTTQDALDAVPLPAPGSSEEDERPRRTPRVVQESAPLLALRALAQEQEQDAEAVSEMLGSSSSTAALGNDTAAREPHARAWTNPPGLATERTTSRHDTLSSDVAAPGAPILSRRQFPLTTTQDHLASRDTTASTAGWDEPVHNDELGRAPRPARRGTGGEERVTFSEMLAELEGAGLQG